MSFNGSGTYTLPGAALSDGQTVSAAEHNTLRNDLATALSDCVTRDGQSPAIANLPMGGFKLSGLAAGSGNGESVRYEQLTKESIVGLTTASSPQFTAVNIGHASDTTITRVSAGIIAVEGVNLLTTATGLTPATGASLAGATFTGDIAMSGASIFDANASVAAHATTCDPWSLGNYVTLTGGAVTFTGMANAPQAGAEVELYMNAAHVFTDGAVFEVDGAQNYTATIGDRVLLRAKSTTVFTVHPRKKDGTAVVGLATALKSATTSVDVSAATAPSSGQVLTATSSTTATWQASGAIATRFTSAAQTISNAGGATIAHSLSGIPTMMTMQLKCLTTDNGWAVNDIIQYPIGHDTDASQSGAVVGADATNIYYRYMAVSQPLTYINKSSGAAFTLTNASWEAYFSAWL